MADFSKYYPKLLVYEGGYASPEYAASMNDKGGETYLGIARNYNPKWPGWVIIDEIKKKRTIKYNEKIEDPTLYKLAEILTEEKYWDKMLLDGVFNQSVAEMIADYGFNSGMDLSMKTVQQIVEMPVTGVFKTADIEKINAFNQLVLFSTLQARRISMITNSTKINPKFKNGLIARAKSFTFKKQ
jgi:lysozyme family protein